MAVINLNRNFQTYLEHQLLLRDFCVEQGDKTSLTLKELVYLKEALDNIEIKIGSFRNSHSQGFERLSCYLFSLSDAEFQEYGFRYINSILTHSPYMRIISHLHFALTLTYPARQHDVKNIKSTMKYAVKTIVSGSGQRASLQAQKPNKLEHNDGPVSWVKLDADDIDKVLFKKILKVTRIWVDTFLAHISTTGILDQNELQEYLTTMSVERYNNAVRSSIYVCNKMYKYGIKRDIDFICLNDVFIDDGKQIHIAYFKNRPVSAYIDGPNKKFTIMLMMQDDTLYVRKFLARDLERENINYFK